MNNKFVAERTAELFLAKFLSELAGELTGKQVSSAHRCVVEKICSGKTSWDLLECIVDNMEKMYNRIKEVGYEKAMEEVTCSEFIVRR
ncbi:MAG: hypothetical protein QW803_12100 [Candidatus Methanomethylicia archaeon]